MFNIFDYIIIIFLAMALVGAVISIYMRKKKGKGCCGCNGDCSVCNGKR